MDERRCLRFADSGVFIFKINAILVTSFFDKILCYLCLFAILKLYKLPGELSLWTLVRIFEQFAERAC